MKNHYSLQSFVRYVLSFKWQFLLVCMVFAVADMLIAIVPYLIGQLVASVSDPHGTSTGLWVGALIVSSIGHDTAWRTAEVLYLRLLNARGNRYDDVIFHAVIHQKYSYFVDKFSGKVSSYTNSLGREFRELLDNFCYNYIDLFIKLPVVSIIMFTVNLYTGIIFLANLAAMFVVGRKLSRLTSSAEKQLTDARSNMDGYIVDTIANFVSVKAFGKERDESSYIHHRRDHVIKTANRSLRQDIIFWGVMSFFVRWLIWPSTILLNVYLYYHHHISLAGLTTFLSAIVLFAQFIWEIIWNTSQVTIRLARTEEAYRYLFGTQVVTQQSNVHEAHRPRPLTIANNISLHDISFAYPDKPDVPVLQHVSLNIKVGEKVGVVGRSGSGKTTLMKLLLGYYPLPENCLLIDGAPVDNQTLTDVMSYVPQDTALFHRSITENITYGKPDATKGQIVRAAKHAQAHEFIENLGQGYDTLVGERGVKLSGGQRQRIAIARAILKDAAILILDEATSALDSQSEVLVQAGLQELMENRTAIVIAHRLSTIQKMDRIIVLENGTIAEQGNHAELLKQNGLYARLWAHQSGGFIEE